MDSSNPGSPRATAPASTPSLMRAAVYDRFGGPEVLNVRNVPIPVPGQGEVLIRVRAAGLNPKDVKVRAAPLPPWSRGGFPRGTGFDFAGEVQALGSRVTDLERRRRVWGFLDGAKGGTAAEFVCVPRAWLSPMPARLGWVEAAAIPLAATTALQSLRDLARLSSGERLLIKGASGGVGSAAIQIAKTFGAHVTATASGAGLDHVRALGADAVVDHRRTDLASIADRFDVFLDCAGRSPWRSYRRIFTRNGRWVTVAPSLAIYAIAPVSGVLRHVIGGPGLAFVVVRPRSADLEAIAALVERGQLRMPVAETFRLDEIRAAHDAVARGAVLGKRVLVVEDA